MATKEGGDVLKSLHNLHVNNVDGETLPASTLLPKENQQFQLRMQSMVPLASILKANGVRLLFITSSESKQTQEFLQTSTVPLCGEIFDDPHVATYKLFQLKHGVFRSVVRPLWTGFKKYGFKGLVEGVRLGYETSHLAGDSWQQGGTVLIDHSGRVQYQHTEEHPADWPDMEEVMRLAGISDSHVDYKKAVSDWLKSRDDQRSTN